MNVLNPAISKIHFLQNSRNCTIFEDLQIDPSFPLDLFRSKLVLTYAKAIIPDKRLTISQVFEYANQAVSDGYVILGNLDVIFDHSLLLLATKNLFPRQTIFYLSRYEIDPSISTLGPQCSEEHYVGSHDALIFQPLIPKTIIEELPFEIGTWNIEVKIISLFIDHHYQVKNSCKSLRIWHYHSSQVRHRAMPSKKYIADRSLAQIMRPPEYLWSTWFNCRFFSLATILLHKKAFRRINFVYGSQILDERLLFHLQTVTDQSARITRYSFIFSRHADSIGEFQNIKLSQSCISDRKKPEHIVDTSC